MIYLDHASCTPALPCATKAFLNAPFGNPNSSHIAGENARCCLEKAKETMLRLLGAAKHDTIIFTSGASEGAAIAMKSLFDNCNIVAVNNTDHHCVTEYPIPYASKDKPYEYGMSRMLFQNEVGEILPAPDLPFGSLWACDITAGVGHVPFSFKDYPKMSYAFGDAMKFGGIPGCGFLLVKKGAPISQMIYGAPNRGGTPPVALIAAMAAALEWQCDYMEANTYKIDIFADVFYETLRNKVIGWQTNSPTNRVPNILNVSFDGVDGKTLALLCSKRGVMISAGAACTSGDNAPSHVIMAMYHDEARARSAVRISFSHENTSEEVEQAAKIIAECVAELRAMS